MYSEQTQYYSNFGALCVGLCQGRECRGWHLSELDTWHQCRAAQCGGAGRPHPESEDEHEDEMLSDEDAAMIAALQDEREGRLAALRDASIPF